VTFSATLKADDNHATILGGSSGGASCTPAGNCTGRCNSARNFDGNGCWLDSAPTPWSSFTNRWGVEKLPGAAAFISHDAANVKAQSEGEKLEVSADTTQRTTSICHNDVCSGTNSFVNFNSYTTMSHIQQTNPDTAAHWTIDEINDQSDAGFRVEVVSGENGAGEYRTSGANAVVLYHLFPQASVYDLIGPALALPSLLGGLAFARFDVRAFERFVARRTRGYVAWSADEDARVSRDLRAWRRAAWLDLGAPLPGSRPQPAAADG